MPNPRLTPTLAERTAHRIGADTAGDFSSTGLHNCAGDELMGVSTCASVALAGVHRKQQSEVNPDP